MHSIFEKRGLLIIKDEFWGEDLECSVITAVAADGTGIIYSTHMMPLFDTGGVCEFVPAEQERHAHYLYELTREEILHEFEKVMEPFRRQQEILQRAEKALRP